MVRVRRRTTREKRRGFEAWRSQLWDFRWDLIKLEGIVVAASVLALLMPSPAHEIVLFEVGVLAATAIWLPFLVLVMRTYPETTGSWAEEWTSQLLKSRSLGWVVIDDIPMQGRNVDHVAVTPAAVLAVETKYRGAGGGRWRTEQHERDLDQAFQSARSVRSLLRSVDINQVAPVQAVLIIWGGGAPDIEGGWRNERGVDVVLGQDGATWARRYVRGELSTEQLREIAAGLLEYQARRDAFTR
jgi:hypothetical protein